MARWRPIWGRERIGVTFNILVGGPGTTAQTAVDDALTTARFALQTGRDANIAVDLNLHPYYRKCPRAIALPRPPPLFAPDGRDGGRRACRNGCPLFSTNFSTQRGVHRNR